MGKIDTSTGVITYSLQIGTDASLPPSNTSPVLAPGGIAVADNNVKFIAGSYFDNTTFPDGKYVNCTNKDKGCCFMAKVTGTTFSWVSDFAGITAGTCGEAIGAKPDGSKVYAYAQNRIAEFDGTTGAVARTLSVSTPSLTWPQVHGMVVIGTDLFVAFTFETNITVGSVTVRGKAAVTTAIFKISLSSFTVTAGQNIANDFTADCRVRSMEPAYNSTTGALVLSMTTYDRVLQVNGTTVKTFATEVAIGYAVIVLLGGDDCKRMTDIFPRSRSMQIAITVLLSSDLQFVSGSALGGPEAGNLVEEMFEDDAAYAVSDPYNNGAVITVGMMTRTFYCSVYNGSIIGDDGAFFVTRYNATTLEQA